MLASFALHVSDISLTCSQQNNLGYILVTRLCSKKVNPEMLKDKEKGINLAYFQVSDLYSFVMICFYFGTFSQNYFSSFLF